MGGAKAEQEPAPPQEVALRVRKSTTNPAVARAYYVLIFLRAIVGGKSWTRMEDPARGARYWPRNKLKYFPSELCCKLQGSKTFDEGIQLLIEKFEAGVKDLRITLENTDA
ncbi:unnamed protein product [Acanthoscelides obtectus]|uniref:Uncharacterized protein n=1 Tax=Acanthoscelides obtectus TaxID=200917 RepID=A0A9P0LUF4_ACAOB|nr:unnamed protein product [Acanthoscelides obtectus]